MKKNTIILGAGITGLSAGVNTGNTIYEAQNIPGGICASYYINKNIKKTYMRVDDDAYRFEIGGGHWIFGSDKKILNFINKLSPVKNYDRKSGVFFQELGMTVPYPLQNHLSYLPKNIANKALSEITKSNSKKKIKTLADWLMTNFGKTLCDIFFFPFHELYTAGLYTRIVPQDKYKTPIDKNLILKGFKDKTPSIGYNATFVYPKKGLDSLIRNMAQKCVIEYNKEIVKIDIKEKGIVFKDSSIKQYDRLITTLPLDKMIKICGLNNLGRPDPVTSVLVFNIGAKKGRKCPDEHWLYIPKSNSGFHRVGFYSNVDETFLPESVRQNKDRISVYVEKSFFDKKRPYGTELLKLTSRVVNELKEWEFISDVDVIDTTWLDYGYTWRYPDSQWVDTAISRLKKYDIYQTGRYGKWKFQGILESMRDGLGIIGG